MGDMGDLPVPSRPLPTLLSPHGPHRIVSPLSISLRGNKLEADSTSAVPG